MHKPIHAEAAELVLASMFKKSDRGFRSQFIIAKPGRSLPLGGIGATLFYEHRQLVRAILFIRKHGASYLRYLSVSDIESMVQKFVTSSYWVLSNETLFVRFEGSYAMNITAPAKAAFADALAVSPLFAPSVQLTVFPLVPLQVREAFDASSFFFAPATRTLGPERLPANVKEEWVPTDQFPPDLGFKGRISTPNAWLGIRSPEYKAAEKMKAAVLGALALTQLASARYMCSGREVFGGHAELGESIIYSFGESHTPALMHDISLTEADHGWLTLLAEKLASETKIVRRQLRALEYYYRAWFLSESERFPIMCMTLDAVFGEANHATQAIIDGVRATLGAHVEDPRLRALMELRAAVIHGGAPDVYDSRKYARYYDDYGADPIRDLDLVVSHCLRHYMFGEAMVEHPHPEAELIAKFQAEGRLPLQFDEFSILDPLRPI